MPTEQDLRDYANSRLSAKGTFVEYTPFVGATISLPIFPTGCSSAYLEMLADFGMYCIQQTTKELWYCIKQTTQELTIPENAEMFAVVTRQVILDNHARPYDLSFQDGPQAHKVSEMLKHAYRQGLEQGRRERAGA